MRSAHLQCALAHRLCASAQVAVKARAHYSSRMIKHPNDMPAAFAAAFNSGKVDALLALYRHDAVFLPDGQAELTGPAIAEALKGFLALKGPIDMKLVRVVAGPDTAVVIADWSLKTPDGGTLTGRTNDIVAKSTDGSWTYVVDAPFGIKA